jgi:hypothetical protein
MTPQQMLGSIFLHLSVESEAITCAAYFDYDRLAVARTIWVSLSYLSVASLVSLLLSLARQKLGANGSKPTERNSAVGRHGVCAGPVIHLADRVVCSIDSCPRKIAGLNALGSENHY